MTALSYPWFVGRISGRIGDLVYSWNSGKPYTRTHPLSVPGPRSVRQQFCRHNIGIVSKLWEDLPDNVKSRWNSFASKHKGAASGVNHFVSLNCSILNANHPDLVFLQEPPPKPSSPLPIHNLNIRDFSNTQVRISWTNPDQKIFFITAHFRLHHNFCRINPDYGLCPTAGYRPSWRFIETVRSDIRSIVFNHTWPSGTRLYFRCISLDRSGRKSPFSYIAQFRIP